MVKIPYQAADQITLCSLKEHVKMLSKELKNHKKNGTYMHSEDAERCEKVWIPAFKTLIDYYQGTCD